MFIDNGEWLVGSTAEERRIIERAGKVPTNLSLKSIPRGTATKVVLFALRTVATLSALVGAYGTIILGMAEGLILFVASVVFLMFCDNLMQAILLAKISIPKIRLEYLKWKLRHSDRICWLAMNRHQTRSGMLATVEELEGEDSYEWNEESIARLQDGLGDMENKFNPAAILLGGAVARRVPSEEMAGLFSRHPDIVDGFLFDPKVNEGFTLLKTENASPESKLELRQWLDARGEQVVDRLMKLDEPYQEIKRQEADEARESKTQAQLEQQARTSVNDQRIAEIIRGD